ncbi:hypothetical protein JTE90_022253 [Oedothorax gibbosus]|uniref:Uncharacterized protein n=1 Tax=Oedothorax gibbosus TaxID=931172 RepID=A0AAV6VX37_9ARAC|nr:hypothetical protein JTE90_022253 [Oedothorax gibbosus]
MADVSIKTKEQKTTLKTKGIGNQRKWIQDYGDEAYEPWHMQKRNAPGMKKGTKKKGKRKRKSKKRADERRNSQRPLLLLRRVVKFTWHGHKIKKREKYSQSI